MFAQPVPDIFEAMNGTYVVPAISHDLGNNLFTPIKEGLQSGIDNIIHGGADLSSSVSGKVAAGAGIGLLSAAVMGAGLISSQFDNVFLPPAASPAQSHSSELGMDQLGQLSPMSGLPQMARSISEGMTV